MEIRTLQAPERDAFFELTNGWELPDGWRGRDYFGRYVDHDPTYADENVWVAVEAGRLVSCVQIFPRKLRILGHPVPTGGIGTVFTHSEYRRKGYASALLEQAVEAMRQRGMEISLLFAARVPFYERLGWKSWEGMNTVLRMTEGVSPVPPPDGMEVRAFQAGHDLESLKAVYDHYSAPRNGTVVRDQQLWQASLVLAGNPAEEFMVARRGDHVLAYVRAALINGVFTISELARLDEPGCADALAALLVGLLQPRDDDPLLPPGGPSKGLRAFMAMPSFDDIPLTVALEQQGVSAHPISDPSALLRCLDVPALAERLNVSLLPGEGGDDFLHRILPPDSFVFWPADRF